MVSDRGRQFISGAWKAFANQLGMKHLLSTAYHPQMDGQMERVNQVVEQYLRMYCNYEQNDWTGLLDTAVFVYNNTIHNSIGVSPFFACYGWNLKAHPDIPQHLGANNPEHSEYLLDGKEHCKYLQEQIREAQHHTVNHYNWRHKDIEFKVGDMVVMGLDAQEAGGSLVHMDGAQVSGPDIDRTEGSSPLRSGDHFKHQVNTLDTRVDATNLITNTINLIIIDATNLIINPINLIIIDITNLITNTINLIIINTHTRPWCHHNIDIDRAELPLNGVSTEVSRNLR
ncbi:hypothetical protein NDA12_006725 [Ustilago hordei]|nr:hypothetical protein NDA12_006725 [Ustilago hordei]